MHRSVFDISGDIRIDKMQYQLSISSGLQDTTIEVDVVGIQRASVGVALG